MKRKISFAVLLCMLLAGTGFSQIDFGVRGAVSRTNITDIHKHSKSRIGYQIAVLSRIPITDNYILYFQPEIQYSAQGEFERPFDENMERVSQKAFFSFINIPLNLKVYLSDAEDTFFITGGPFLGFMLDKEIEVKVPGMDTDLSKYKTFDFGVGLGVGLSFHRKLEGSLRYSYGLTDLALYERKNKMNSSSNLNLGLTYFFN